jgi:hypothetical protein
LVKIAENNYDNIGPQVIEDAEKQNKISELYDLVHQSESMASALPEVVDRLEALQGLHDQGSRIFRYRTGFFDPRIFQFFDPRIFQFFNFFFNFSILGDFTDCNRHFYFF